MKYPSAYLMVVGWFFLTSDPQARTLYLNPQDTLCDADEAIYISCSLDAGSSPSNYDSQIASVCAKGNLSPGTGYVQYRYGNPGAEVEYIYPQEKSPPQRKFKIYPPTKELRSALRFKDGQYSYSFEAKGLAGYRLIVKVGEQEVANKRCDEPGITHLVDAAYRGIEPGEAERVP